MFLPRPVTDAWREQRGRSLLVLGRAGPDVEREVAQLELEAIAGRLERDRPESNEGWGVNVVPLKEQVVGGSRKTLVLLWAAVGLVLVVVVVNVCNLLLGRGLARRREIAIRTALGAGRFDIVRQLVVEGFLLCGTSTLFAVAVAHGAIDAIGRASPIPLPRLETAVIDGAVLLYALGATILTTLVCGLVPIVQTRTGDIQRALREAGTSTSPSRGHARLRAALVVSEVALAVVLVASAGLLVRTLLALRSVDAGFERRAVLTMRLALPDRYDTDAARMAFFDEFLEPLSALPGVSAPAIVSSLPLTGPHVATSFYAAGGREPARGEAPVADIRVIDGDYFRAMGIPLLAGRLFDSRDSADAPLRAIVSRASVRTLWPADAPSTVLGRSVRISWDGFLSAEIIGVVGDVRHHGLDVTPRSMIYWTYEQNAWSDMTLVARVQDAAASMVPVLSHLRALDPGVATFDVASMEDVLASSVADRRVSSFVLGMFALVALGLASLGVYGVVAFAGAARRREMGLRLAMGARPSHVMVLVLGGALAPVAMGVGLGLLGALFSAQLAASLLYEVSPVDPPTLVASAFVLLLAALVAAYLPARRASRLDPVSALRSD